MRKRSNSFSAYKNNIGKNKKMIKVCIASEIIKSNKKSKGIKNGKWKGHTLGVYPTSAWFEARLQVDLW